MDVEILNRCYIIINVVIRTIEAIYPKKFPLKEYNNVYS